MQLECNGSLIQIVYTSSLYELSQSPQPLSQSGNLSTVGSDGKDRSRLAVSVFYSKSFNHPVFTTQSKTVDREIYMSDSNIQIQTNCSFFLLKYYWQKMLILFYAKVEGIDSQQISNKPKTGYLWDWKDTIGSKWICLKLGNALYQLNMSPHKYVFFMLQ